MRQRSWWPLKDTPWSRRIDSGSLQWIYANLYVASGKGDFSKEVSLARCQGYFQVVASIGVLQEKPFSGFQSVTRGGEGLKQMGMGEWGPASLTQCCLFWQRAKTDRREQSLGKQHFLDFSCSTSIFMQMFEAQVNLTFAWLAIANTFRRESQDIVSMCSN